LVELKDSDLRHVVRARVSQKLSEVAFKYPVLYADVRSFPIDHHVNKIFERTEDKNARELANNAEKYVIDLFVERILTL
jgi:hypothetical protein